MAGVPTVLSTGPWRQAFGEPSCTLPVVSPTDGETIAHVEQCGAAEVDAAVRAAQAAAAEWASKTLKQRAAVMMRFHQLVTEHAEELVELIVRENGKNVIEARGDLAKGLETVEWAISMPNMCTGRKLTVSSGVSCEEIREPIGVVASIVPFNFPFMVPMWTTPIALVAGNAVILKPSEKVPMTMARAAALLTQAGVPDGVFQTIHGGVDAVNALCDHKSIAALTFVGSSKVRRPICSGAMTCIRFGVTASRASGRATCSRARDRGWEEGARARRCEESPGGGARR